MSAENKLIEWEDRGRSTWKRLVEQHLPDEIPSRYADGIWTVTYVVQSEELPISNERLLRILKDVEGRESGWPPWWVPERPDIAPHTTEDGVECWMINTRFEDAAHSDFWRVSRDGAFFLLRGYQEDGLTDGRPVSGNRGKWFDFTIPVYRTAEVLLHATRFARALPTASERILFRFCWTGLRDRDLGAYRMQYALPLRAHSSRSDSAGSQVALTVEDIENDLTGAVSAVTAPLYAAFDFIMPAATIRRELNEMARNQF